jgi:hypothetical protein
LESSHSSKTHNEVAVLARVSGISVPEERLEALAMGLNGLLAVADALARIDYDLIEPAPRFKVPPSR